MKKLLACETYKLDIDLMEQLEHMLECLDCRMVIKDGEINVWSGDLQFDERFEDVEEFSEVFSDYVQERIDKDGSGDDEWFMVITTLADTIDL